MTTQPHDPFEDEATLAGGEPAPAPRPIAEIDRAANQDDADSTIARWTRWLGDDVENLDTERSLSLHAPELESTELGPEDFEAEEPIAEGGSGVIYRARQRNLDRVVALKKSKPGPRTRQAAFVAEARLTGALEHPNIVPVYGLGRDRDGEPHLAMKLVEGRSWREALRSGELERDKSLRILLSVCAALRFAHEQKGVLHRDIKPGNVMLGEYGEVLLMDWGLALTLDRVQIFKEARGRKSVAALKPAGTPAYMAPEMVDGRVWDFGPWTDVFLLGATLHEVLTGAPPYRNADFWRGLSRAAACEPQRYDDDAPAELVALARKAMARSIPERLQSVRAFEKGLEEYLAHREAAALAQRGAALFEEGREAWDLRNLGRGLTYYEQSLDLWPEQDELRQRLFHSRGTMGRIAIDRGDLALARLVSGGIPVDHPERVELEAAIDRAERAARRRQRRYRFAQVAAVALALVVIVGAILTQSLLARARAQEQRRRIDELLAAAAGSAGLAGQKLEAIPSLEEAVRRLELASRRAPWAALDHPSKRAVQEARGRLSDAVEAERRARAQALFELSAADNLSREGWPALAREARDAIARILEARILAAEARRDPAERRALVAELRARCGAEHPAVQALSAARGALAIDSRPSGAAVALFRFEATSSGLLEPRPILRERALRTPLELSLAPGSYLARVAAPGTAEAAYPFAIERGKTWPRDFLASPGLDALGFESEELAARCQELRLYSPEAVGADFVQVPAGPYLRGDPGRWSVLPYDLFVCRYEVSVGEYRATLQRLPYELRGATGPGDPASNPYERDQAMAAVTWIEAARHCRWLPRREGLGPARLLSDGEWEKAARGVDGRRFPWGEAFDFSLTDGGLSQRGGPTRRPRGAFPRDASVYDIRDLAGGVSEWTGYHPEGALVESVDPVSGATARVALRQRGLAFGRLGGRGERRRVRGGDWRADEPRAFETTRGAAAPAGEASPRRGFRIVRLSRDEAERRRRFARAALRRKLTGDPAGLTLLAALERLQDADRSEDGSASLALASLYRRLGDAERALESALHAAELFERRREVSPEAILGLREALAQLHALALARRSFPRAVALARRIDGLGPEIEEALPAALAARFRVGDAARLAETALTRGQGRSALAALEQADKRRGAYVGEAWGFVDAELRAARAQALQLVGRLAEAEEASRAALAAYEALPSERPLARSFALEVAARIARDQGRVEEGLALSRRAALLTARLVALDGDAPVPLSNHARSLERLADFYHALGRFEAARRSSEEALALRRRVIALAGETPASSDALALGLEIGAGIAADSGRPSEALALGRQSVALRRDLHELDPSSDNALDLAVGLAQLARLHDGAGDSARALAVGGRGVDLARRALPELSPTLTIVRRAASVFENQAAFLAEAGREREALAMIEASYRLHAELLRRHRSADLTGEVVNLLQQKAQLLLELDDLAGGEAAAEEARRLATLGGEAQSGASADLLGATLFALARLRERAGDVDEALVFLDQAEALFIKAEAAGPSPRARRHRLTALALASRLLIARGDKAEALRRARQASVIARGLSGDGAEDRRYQAYAGLAEGRALRAVGELAAAAAVLERAEADYRAIRGELGPRPELCEEEGATAFQRSEAARQQDQAAEAEAAIRRAVAAYRLARVRREARRRPTRSLARSLEALADLRAAAGDRAASAEALAEAVALLRGLSAEAATDGRLLHELAITSSKLSDARFAIGQASQGMTRARAAAAYARQARAQLPGWRPATVNLHFNLHQLRNRLLAGGERAEALALSEELLALVRRWNEEEGLEAGEVGEQAARWRRLAVSLGMVAELCEGARALDRAREGLAAARRSEELEPTAQAAAIVRAFEELIAAGGG